MNRTHRPARRPFPRPLLCLILLAAAGATLWGRPAWAVNAEVRDDANLFDAATRQYANEQIAQIKQKHGLDLMVETFPTFPDEFKARFEQVKGDKAGREKLFGEWAQQRSAVLGENGIYLLICKEPGHLEVVVGNHTQRKDFTLANRDTLRDGMLKEFGANKFNDGLRRGVDYVRKTLDANMGGGTVAPRRPVCPARLLPARPFRRRSPRTRRPLHHRRVRPPARRPARSPTLQGLILCPSSGSASPFSWSSSSPAS